MLEVKNLVKTYGGFRAVDGISFSIVPGTCFGLLGPNGAGKTTTLEMIEDVAAPDQGEIRYKGQPRHPSFREEVGIQFQETALLNFLSVRETLQTFSALYHRPAGIDELIELCHLREIQGQYNDKISGGQKQRLLLALALVNRPELLFLDEPSTGLDPQARWELWRVIETLKQQGETIVLTTHYMEEAQVLCDEIAIMDRGRIIARGSPEALIRRHCRGETLVIPRSSFPTPPDRMNINARVAGDKVEIAAGDINVALKTLLAMGVDMSEMAVRSPNLESVFLNLTGRQLRE
jgi:ABC-2 type transport system ATP-binding protein